MTLGTAVNIHLKANAGVAAIAAGRVYPVNAPQNDPPNKAAHVIHQLSGWNEETDIGGNALLRRKLVCDCLAGAYDDSQALFEAVIATFRNFYGLMGGVGGVEIKHCLVTDDTTDIFSAELAAAGIFQTTAVFEIAINI